MSDQRDIIFTVPGKPVAKGRQRITARGGFARSYTPARTVAYEGLVAMAGQEAMDGRPPLQGPLMLKLTATFPIAPSWTKRKREDAASGKHMHTSKPDIDNIIKAAADALNGIAYDDDSQVVAVLATKRYGETPGLDVKVGKL